MTIVRTSQRTVPCAEWKDLCDDVRWAILGKLSLREHARVTTTCRNISEPYVARRDQERASLLEAAKESYGKNMLSTVLEVGKHPMRGLPAHIASLVKRREPLPGGPVDGKPLTVFISDQQPPTYSPPGKGLENAPDGWVNTGYDRSRGSTLRAMLLHWSSCRRYLTQTQLDIFKVATADVRLKVAVSNLGVRPAMGLVLAMCLQAPEPTSSRPRRLVVDFFVEMPRTYPSSVREAENLMEVLRAILSPAWSHTTLSVVDNPL